MTPEASYAFDAADENERAIRVRGLAPDNVNRSQLTGPKYPEQVARKMRDIGQHGGIAPWGNLIVEREGRRVLERTGKA